MFGNRSNKKCFVVELVKKYIRQRIMPLSNIFFTLVLSLS